MKALICSLVVLCAVCEGLGVEKITSVTLEGKELEEISNVRIGVDGRIIISVGSGAMYATTADKLPTSFLQSWGIGQAELAKGKTDAERRNADEFEKAVRGGLFREVAGVIYDLRKSQPGWTTFSDAKVFQVLEGEHAALVDMHPGTLSLDVIYVKNLGPVSDTERLGFRAMAAGTYSYINKDLDRRVVRAYDAGKPCARNRVPEVFRKGEVASYPAPVSDRPQEASGNAFDPATGLPAPASEHPSRRLDQPVGSGTGFFITEDGYLITNDHVVRGAARIQIRTRALVAEAGLVRSSRAFDLALLKVNGRFTALALDLDRSVGLGEPVFTIGFPNTDLQGKEPKYTDGKISSLAGIEDDPSQFQISVPIQPGNSGGALVAENGGVVGVVRAKLNDVAALAVSGSVPQNVNYAVKAKYLKDLLEPVPGLLPAVKHPSTKAKAENAIKVAEEASAMVLVY